MTKWRLITVTKTGPRGEADFTFKNEQGDFVIVEYWASICGMFYRVGVERQIVRATQGMRDAVDAAIAYRALGGEQEFVFEGEFFP